MRSAKVVKEEMAKTIKEIEVARDELVKAETDGDEAKAKETLAVIEAKEATFEKLDKELEQLEAHQAKITRLKKIEDMAAKELSAVAPTAPAGDGPDATPATAKDHDAAEKARSDAFYKYLRGGRSTLSGKENEALEPTSEKLREGKAAGSVLVPRSLTCKVMGSKYTNLFAPDLQAKALLSSSLVAGAAVGQSGAGNLFQAEFRPQLNMLPMDVPTLMDRLSVIPSVAGTVQWPALMQTDANEFGGASFSWISEGAQKPETEPNFQQLEINTHEIAGYTEIGERMLSRSAIDLEAVVVMLFRGGMNWAIENAVLQGTGVGQPLGIINTAGIRLVVRNTAGQVVYIDLVNLKHAVKPNHRAGAIFGVEDSVEQGLELQVDGQNRPLFRASMANGPYDRLIGYPYTVSLNLPGMGTQGDIVFGDFGQYMLVVEEEVTVSRSEHYRFRNNVVAFKIFAVVGGRLLQPRAMAILEGPES